MYRSEQSKLAAFQFRDPFAADQFVVCHVPKGICCRPNCDFGNQDYRKQDLRFYSSLDEAIRHSFVPCRYCFPETQQKVIDWQDGSHVAIDLDLLLDTVRHVNHDINFFPPLLEEDSRKTDLLRQFIWESTNKKLKQKLLTGVPYRASPKGSDTMMQPTSPESVNLTKNEFDRLKLIDMACRHIALAASSTVPEVCTPHAELLSTESSHGKRSGSNSSKKQRRRRGGVLGFKELAAKSNLSPWHFHRVFKSVTGLTPKNYGDRCCEYIKQQAKGSGGTRIVVINTRIANPTMAAEDSQQNINSGSHRTDSRLESSVSPVQHSSLASSPVSAPSVMSTSPTTTTKSSKTPLFHTEDADEESWQPVKYRKISAEGWSPSDDPLAGLRPEESLAEANLEDLVSMLPRPFDISDPSAISLPNAPNASETILAADVWQQQQH
ncbi:DEKNAAC105578 [Brettanomyces naardenensis]|uniref:DEKNAAC105578 n=1 Tax=Brettanomyces naardenensis TaxID=13370 RepID=A0A448YTY9_BRENA|nr:DEKNAAC105578 [Brettanomyces naardenensis]